MHAVLSYHVYTTRDDGLWLAEDERSWTRRFLESACFKSAELATEIGEAAERPDDTIYVFACMGS